MSYIKAEDVRSPRGAWALIQVLYDGGPSTDDEGAWSLCVGEWYGKRRLAARWNGQDEGGSAAGNPSARGYPTWFIVPPEFEEPLMAVVPADKLTLAKALLNQK
ncbi:hypothetical protein [Methylobacterium brachythecii]|nr:hypothetical protein [Methylobacterium brachythecii]MBB3905667.1 hypothetical protein [Methylobacterium brachythecii]